jgi:hypothetical protein
MRELMRRKRLRVLKLIAERIDILEMMAPESMMVEAMKMSTRCRLVGVHPTFGSG